MTFSKLETLTRQAACEALGASIEGFDKWLDTYDTGEVMRPRGAVDYACVELTFNSSMQIGRASCRERVSLAV